jgi:hypothetical protein
MVLLANGSSSLGTGTSLRDTAGVFGVPPETQVYHPEHQGKRAPERSFPAYWQNASENLRLHL